MAYCICFFHFFFHALMPLEDAVMRAWDWGTEASLVPPVVPPRLATRSVLPPEKARVSWYRDPQERIPVRLCPVRRCNQSMDPCMPAAAPVCHCCDRF
jgi:hypothetical protein